jgi:hypothetical protein
MKHHRYRSSRGTSFNHEKHRAQQWKQEHTAGGFRCSHCKQFVIINDIMGTVNRNHCNLCLWSKHVDVTKGDRRADCHGGMEPIGLTLKHEGKGKIGELMLIHVCSICNKLSINRLARDDLDYKVLEVFASSKVMPQKLHDECIVQDIYVLTERDEPELNTQLFGIR